MKIDNSISTSAAQKLSEEKNINYDDAMSEIMDFQEALLWRLCEEYNERNNKHASLYLLGLDPEFTNAIKNTNVSILRKNFGDFSSFYDVTSSDDVKAVFLQIVEIFTHINLRVHKRIRGTVETRKRLQEERRSGEKPE